MKDGGLLTLSDLMLLLPPRCANSEPLNPKVPFILVNMHYSNKNSDDFGNSKTPNDLIPTELEVPSLGEGGVDGKFIPSDLSSHSSFSHPLPSISGPNPNTNPNNNDNHDNNNNSGSGSGGSNRVDHRILSTAANSTTVVSAIPTGDQGNGNNRVRNPGNSTGPRDDSSNANDLNGNRGNSVNSNPSISTATTAATAVTATTATPAGTNTTTTIPPTPTPAPSTAATTAAATATTSLSPTVLHRNYFDVISLHRSGGRNSQNLGIRTLERCRYIAVHNRRWYIMSLLLLLSFEISIRISMISIVLITIHIH